MDSVLLLTHFGLTQQEAKLYWALFSQGDLTGYEAAKVTGISRSNAYSALSGLVEKGAARLMEGAAARYTPVPVAEFCGNCIYSLQKDAKELSLLQPKRRTDSEGYITIAGKKHILLKMRNLLRGAEERVYASMSAELIVRILPELRGMTERGLKVVVITDHPLDLPGATVYCTEKKQKQIRLIADSSSVLTGDLDDGENSTCLYSKKDNLVSLFKEDLKNEIRLIELTKEREQA
ncbi:Sugar-specific transcriptional regulator TrmB [Caprobacter fermentans]|uniref:Sugar-specific transcriptional regulator TrmB n=1 Tax=Caproicibacter fermentans TaxID=2576756 RepID=A0A6N8I5I6_9FIRM|nr:TrmB family transcriptional regulator [Caproicibacter fermentans]MVB12783.1 Sugar-specific transcriptional regulator TrmB [Caproicibacter fermentans]QNK40310.1 TrmB family transcriptional regulator [Caproicibacter fermentans]